MKIILIAVILMVALFGYAQIPNIATIDYPTTDPVYDTLSIDSVLVMNAISETLTVGGDYIFVSPNRFDIYVTRAEYELMQRDLKEVKIWMNVIKWTAIISIILSLIFLPIVIHNNKEEAE